MRQALWLSALLLALAMLGPVVGQTPPSGQRPQPMGGTVSPSPRPSPQGVMAVAVDSSGRLIVSPSPQTVTLSAGNIGVTSNAGGGSVNVTLPSASPVPVMANAYATATGLATYCQPSFAGGSSEATVSPSPSNLYTFSASNPNTTDVYLTFWDASNPTPGTTSPTAMYTIPAGLGASNRGWRDEAFTPPITFSTAMTMTVVSAANGSGTPTTPISVTLGYK